MVPLPAISKISNNNLNLVGYNLNEGLAMALGKSLGLVPVLEKARKNEIKELYLEGNGMRDNMFAEILKGLLK